jgi:GTP-binding protein YchF
MNIGIIGFPQTGKKTLFRLLAGAGALRDNADLRQVQRGVADVVDSRFNKLLEIYNPRKETRARLEIELLPKLEENLIQQGAVFKDIGQVEALCHVVRVFEDDSVYHVWGGPDPERAIETVRSELVLHDLMFIEKRFKRIEKELKKAKDDTRKKEKVLLERFRDHLEADKPLRLLDISLEEQKLVKSYPFLTQRQMLIALNVSEEQLADDTIVQKLEDRFGGLGLQFVRIAVKTENDIAELDSEEERVAFMEELGITDKALHLLTSKFIEAVGLVSFFTAASCELRQWFVRQGALAPETAGKIHNDMERGFIRAEVLHYADVVEYGSEEAAKNAGKYHVKGKDYEVLDGDILKILFNV